MCHIKFKIDWLKEPFIEFRYKQIRYPIQADKGYKQIRDRYKQIRDRADKGYKGNKQIRDTSSR
jgi:hypothetical protein